METGGTRRENVGEPRLAFELTARQSRGDEIRLIPETRRHYHRMDLGYNQ
jgi:hypothetical protein